MRCGKCGCPIVYESKSVDGEILTTVYRCAGGCGTTIRREYAVEGGYHLRTVYGAGIFVPEEGVS